MYGYSVGYIGQGASYCFIGTYFVVFLSECVGLSAKTASNIAAIALLVEVIVGMIIGNASDNCTSKMGRRRPFILTAAIGMFPIMLLTFYTVPFAGSFRVIYYLILAILFRIFFSCFEITNQAFGAEIAFGYDERTKIRTLSRAFSILGNAVAYLMPLYMLELFPENPKKAWLIIGIIVGLVTSISWYLSFFINKGKGIVLTEKIKKDKTSIIQIFKNYIELIKLKPVKHLILYKAGFGCSFALVNVATIYYMKYSVGLSEGYISYIYYITLAIFILMIPLVSKMAYKMGKTRQQEVVMMGCAIVGFVVFFTCPRTFVGAAVYFGVYSMAQTSFWQISSAIFYDVIEVDEWVNGKRREGDMTSMVSVLGTLISSIMVAVFGWAFDMFGYDASLTVQSSETVSFLNVAFVLIPSICLVVCAISLKSCPINKKTFESLQNALKLRKEGKDYSMYMDDVKKITGEK